MALTDNFITTFDRYAKSMISNDKTKSQVVNVNFREDYEPMGDSVVVVMNVVHKIYKSRDRLTIKDMPDLRKKIDAGILLFIPTAKDLRVERRRLISRGYNAIKMKAKRCR